MVAGFNILLMLIMATVLLVSNLMFNEKYFNKTDPTKGAYYIFEKYDAG